jgi:hypothetical protein
MSDITTDFIKATNKIYAKVAAILTHLQVIEGDVKSIRDQSVKYAGEPSSHSDESDPGSQVKAAIFRPDTVNSGKPNRNQQSGDNDASSFFQNLEKRWKKSIRKPAIQIEIAAVIGLCVYTCETHRTNNLTQRSIESTEKRVRAEDRPYILAQPRPGHGYYDQKTDKTVYFPYSSDGKGNIVFKIAVDVKVLGHSPAVEMNTTASQVIVGPTEEVGKQASDFDPGYPEPTAPLTSMMPEVPPITVITLPSKAVTPEEFQKFKDGTWSVYVVGAVQYRDVFAPRLDHPYRLIYCFKLLPSGMPFGNCINSHAPTQD